MKAVRVINPQFHQALMKLSNQDLPINSAKTVLNILRETKSLTDQYHEGRIEFMSKLAEKNEDGTPKVDSNQNFVFPKENLEKVNKKLKSMMEKEIEFPKVLIKDLGDAKLTAQELSLLEDLLV